jgi:hypothetical protein
MAVDAKVGVHRHEGHAGAFQQLGRPKVGGAAGVASGLAVVTVGEGVDEGCTIPGWCLRPRGRRQY